MGLWDALSGKIWHWNTTWLKVHQHVYPRLQAFAVEKHGIRDFLYASYFAFHRTLSALVFCKHPNIRGGNYIGKLRSVNKIDLMNIASSYFCDSIVLMISGPQDEAQRNLGSYLIVEACLLYDRDQSYANQRLEVYGNAEADTSARLLCSEIALVLGLDPTSEWDMYPWLPIRQEMDTFRIDCMNEPDWNERVTKELSRPPRLGGYPDSIIQ